MPSTRTRQKLILLLAAVATAGILGLLVNILNLGSTATAVLGGLALGLITAFGAPYAFDLSGQPAHKRHVGDVGTSQVHHALTPSLRVDAFDDDLLARTMLPQTAESLEAYNAAQSLLVEFSDVPSSGDYWERLIEAYTLHARVVAASTLRSDVQLIAVVDETFRRTPTIRVTINYDQALRHYLGERPRHLTVQHGTSIIDDKPRTSEVGRFVVPEAQRRSRRGQLALGHLC